MKKIMEGSYVKNGIAIAKVMLFKPYEPNLDTTQIEKNTDLSIKLFEEIRVDTLKDMNQMVSLLKSNKDDKYKIFNAHIEIINDVMLEDQVKQFIQGEMLSTRSAVIKTFNMFIEMFESMEDQLLRERVSDLKDVLNRLLKKIDQVDDIDLSILQEDVIIIAKDLLPSQTATMDKNHVKGFITEIGGLTSHTAILAKSYKIPAVLGVKNINSKFNQGDIVIIDSVNECIIINPTKKDLESFESLKLNYLKEENLNETYKNRLSETKDKIRVQTMLNIGSSHDESLREINIVDGVGLFRSEFLYMENSHFPTEEEQFNAYKIVLDKAKGKPVILRTLDIGGDKTLSYYDLPSEDNPFLGKRALRFCFDEEKIFLTQLRAALRASVFGDLWLMFPMVSHIDDIVKAKEFVHKAKTLLDKEKVPYKNVKIGIMIEVPSIALMAPQVAKLVDFASIGTNDLTQYLMASDRMNAEVAPYYQNYAPSLFKIIKMIADAFNEERKPISVCGELGGDLAGAAILIGLGIYKLSMNLHAIPKIKRLILNNELAEFKELSNKVLVCSSQKEVKDLTNKFLEEKYNV
jgi:phosphotransferase system enzyme I (PtsI)